jgi:hypothetical protein
MSKSLDMKDMDTKSNNDEEDVPRKKEEEVEEEDIIINDEFFASKLVSKIRSIPIIVQNFFGSLTDKTPTSLKDEILRNVVEEMNLWERCPHSQKNWIPYKIKQIGYENTHFCFCKRCGRIIFFNSGCFISFPNEVNMKQEANKICSHIK